MVIYEVPRKKRVNKQPSRHSIWVAAILKSRRARLTIEQARVMLAKALEGTPFTMPKHEGLPFAQLRKALGWDTSVTWSRPRTKND